MKMCEVPCIHTYVYTFTDTYLYVHAYTHHERKNLWRCVFDDARKVLPHGLRVAWKVM